MRESQRFKRKSIESSLARVRKKRKLTRENQVQPVKQDSGKDINDSLPRTREVQVHYPYVIGIDEAGRGPLAGPVVAAAVIIPKNLPGIGDSKKITNEGRRKELYHEIIKSTGVKWAVAVVDAGRIDEINILQASLEAMRMAADALVESQRDRDQSCRHLEATIRHKGCYVTTNSPDFDELVPAQDCYALVDGNRLPTNMPVESEAMVRGDAREYCIAAASILAKVTRDDLMRAYDKEFPGYGLAQHKGYPTAAHVAAVMKNGPTPIHRRTFAPIKHMEL